MTGAGAKPLAIFVRRMLRHVDGRKTFASHSHAWLDIWIRRLRHGIGDGVGVRIGRICIGGAPWHARSVEKHFVFVPRYFANTHPERLNPHATLRTFISV